MNDNNKSGEFFKKSEPTEMLAMSIEPLYKGIHGLDEVADKKEIKYYYSEKASKISTIDVTLKDGKQFQATCRVDNPSQLAAYKWDDLVEVHSCLAGEVKASKRNEKVFEMPKEFEPFKLSKLRDSFNDQPASSTPKPS